jgi:hypothetical protein
MPQIVFPCPNCGASQSVDDTTVSTQCQFCGNTISVPENLRPKVTPPPPAQAESQSYSFGGASGMAPMGMAGMPGLPGMFMNMDLNKLRAMAMAARSGNKAEAARLYSETFGVGPDEAMQAAELMSSHLHGVLNQMQFDTPMNQMGSNAPVVQIGGVPQQLPTPTQGVSYALPSPPMIGGNPRAGGGRWAACVTFAIVLLIAVGIGGAIILTALARVR